MKSINECIEYLNKRLTNNQNIIEVSYFNSILYYLDLYTKSQVEEVTDDDIKALCSDNTN